MLKYFIRKNPKTFQLFALHQKILEREAAFKKQRDLLEAYYTQLQMQLLLQYSDVSRFAMAQSNSKPF